VGLAVAGNTGRVGGLAGLTLPIESHVLQAFVTEPVKPLLHHVVTSGAIHCYISQTDKGELLMGGDLDGYNSYAQRGNLPLIEHVVQAAVTMFPCLSRLRLMRTWGGVMDMTMDGSPIIGKLPVEGLFMDGGWCYGGFKATPGSGWVFAHTLAKGEPHRLNAEFTLDRFHSGRLLDERGAGATPGLH
jgi:sarcosine oxidase subunit beta